MTKTELKRYNLWYFLFHIADKKSENNVVCLLTPEPKGLIL
jgi:hypothetical protein